MRRCPSPDPRVRALASAALLLSLAAAPGCASLDVRAVRLGPSLAPLPASARVVVRRAPVSLPGAREVALLEATVYDGESGVPDALDALRARARAVGADTVVLLRLDRSSGFVRLVASALRTAP